MRYLKYTLYILLMAIVMAACKVPYAPTPVTAITNYLVVEGVINTGADSTIIKLSRTQSLTSGSNLKTELKAQLSIESNQGNTYLLTELGSGSYGCPGLNVGNANQYRLHIKTSDGKTYVSAYTQAKGAMPIDSVTWAATSKGLEVNVNTHDATNNSRYYRWDYTEEWEFHPSFNSQYISDGKNISPRTPSQQIWDCFTGDNSGIIVLATTAKLTQDIVTNANIAIIQSTDERISVKYSINVRQYALTEDAYNYWTELKKNTEELGSIFDAQPSISVGNVTCVSNPAEPVIGYVSAGSVTTQRIFITRSQLPTSWVTIPAYPQCLADSVWSKSRAKPYNDPTEDQYINFLSSTFVSKYTQQIPITPFIAYGIPGYLAAAPICVDCTLRGSKTPPAFWK